MTASPGNDVCSEDKFQAWLHLIPPSASSFTTLRVRLVNLRCAMPAQSKVTKTPMRRQSTRSQRKLDNVEEAAVSAVVAEMADSAWKRLPRRALQHSRTRSTSGERPRAWRQDSLSQWYLCGVQRTRKASCIRPQSSNFKPPPMTER